MPAEEGQRRNRFPFGQGKIFRPVVENIFRLSVRKAPGAFRDLVISLHQQLRVGQGQHHFLGLTQENHGLIESVGAIQHLGQFVAGGIAHEGVAGIGGDQIAQAAFGLFIFAFAAVEHGVEIAGLIVPWIDGQTFTDRGASLLETMVFFREHRQADAGIDAARIGSGGLKEACARLVRAAHRLELMTHHSHQLGVVLGQLDRSAPRAIRHLRAARLESGVAVLVPKQRSARALANQLLIERQGAGELAGGEKLPCSLEIALRLDWHRSAQHTEVKPSRQDLGFKKCKRKQLPSRCVVFYPETDAAKAALKASPRILSFDADERGSSRTNGSDLMYPLPSLSVSYTSILMLLYITIA